MNYTKKQIWTVKYFDEAEHTVDEYNLFDMTEKEATDMIMRDIGDKEGIDNYSLVGQDGSQSKGE